MTLRVSILLGPILALVLVNSFAFADEEPGCITTDCHETMGTKEWVHGPVGVGECQVCHRLTSEPRHSFELTAPGEELCFACHESSGDMMLMESVHTPVAEGKCTGCHDPHESDLRFSLKAQASDLCLQCHEGDEFGQEHVHGPVASGDCNVCHDPHASPNELQLVEPREELCFLCHEDHADLLGMRHVHAPVEEDCTNCHSPHSNAARFLLSEDTPGLCLDCHQELVAVGGVDIKHPPVAEGKCTTCHDPHASDNPSLAPMAPTELCFSCHDELGKYVAGQESLHGPIEDGDCNACHDPHGSDNHSILRQYFPEEFYMPFQEENYDLCFECHNRQIATHENTKTLTEFRDGERNLHYLHVNKEVKGRSCRACHQVHASSQAKHIRTSVPFGKVAWELPVNFTKTENGGSCEVGCHKPKEYSRK